MLYHNCCQYSGQDHFSSYTVGFRPHALLWTDGLPTFHIASAPLKEYSISENDFHSNFANFCHTKPYCYFLDNFLCVSPSFGQVQSSGPRSVSLCLPIITILLSVIMVMLMLMVPCCTSIAGSSRSRSKLNYTSRLNQTKHRSARSMNQTSRTNMSTEIHKTSKPNKLKLRSVVVPSSSKPNKINLRSDVVPSLSDQSMIIPGRGLPSEDLMNEMNALQSYGISSKSVPMKIRSKINYGHPPSIELKLRKNIKSDSSSNCQHEVSGSSSNCKHELTYQHAFLFVSRIYTLVSHTIHLSRLPRFCTIVFVTSILGEMQTHKSIGSQVEQKYHRDCNEFEIIPVQTFNVKNMWNSRSQQDLVIQDFLYHLLQLRDERSVELSEMKLLKFRSEVLSSIALEATGMNRCDHKPKSKRVCLNKVRSDKKIIKLRNGMKLRNDNTDVIYDMTTTELHSSIAQHALSNSAPMLTSSGFTFKSSFKTSHIHKVSSSTKIRSVGQYNWEYKSLTVKITSDDWSMTATLKFVNIFMILKMQIIVITLIRNQTMSRILNTSSTHIQENLITKLSKSFLSKMFYTSLMSMKRNKYLLPMKENSTNWLNESDIGNSKELLNPIKLLLQFMDRDENQLYFPFRTADDSLNALGSVFPSWDKTNIESYQLNTQKFRCVSIYGISEDKRRLGLCTRCTTSPIIQQNNAQHLRTDAISDKSRSELRYEILVPRRLRNEIKHGLRSKESKIQWGLPYKIYLAQLPSPNQPQHPHELSSASMHRSIYKLHARLLNLRFRGFVVIPMRTGYSKAGYSDKELKLQQLLLCRVLASNMLTTRYLPLGRGCEDEACHTYVRETRKRNKGEDLRSNKDKKASHYSSSLKSRNELQPTEIQAPALLSNLSSVT